MDISGKIINLDFEAIEQKYGKSEDIENLKVLFNQPSSFNASIDNEISIMSSAALNKCINKKLKASFNVDSFGPTAISAIIGYIAEEQYKQAATQLLKAGLKANYITILGELTWIYGSCVVKTEGWI